METGDTDSTEELEYDERERWIVDLIDVEDTLRLDTRLDNEFSRHNASKASSSHKQQSPIVIDRYKVKTVYKIETLACVRKEHEIMTNMRDFNCDAVSSPEGFAFVISNQVHLLNANCTEHRAAINLDCRPELVSFNRDSSFLVVGDSLGSIHFIHVASKNIIFSQEIIQTHAQTKEVASDAFKMLAFASPNNSETEQLFIVLRTHIMFRFSNLHMRNLCDAIEAGDAPKAMKLKEAISIEIVDLNSPHTLSINDLSWTFEKSKMSIFVAGNGRFSLTSWLLNYPTSTKPSPLIFLSDGVSRLLHGTGIIKIHITNDERWLVALDENGKLSLWERRSLNLLCQYHNDPIIDFNIMPSSTTTSTFCIVALTTACGECSSPNRYIVVILLPEFSTVHRFPVENKCWLVKPQKGLEDTAGTIYFIEAREDSDERDTKLYIRALNETLPLQRFQQLILKKHFKEAEALAALFELDEQIVIKAKLSSILTKMNDDHKSIEWNNDLLNDLICDLSTIKDHLFRIDFCLRAIFSSYTQTYRFLCYAQQIIRDIGYEPSGIITQTVAMDVHRAVRRLGTWLLICANLQEHSIEDEHSYPSDDRFLKDERIAFNGKRWQIFRMANMVTEMRRLIGTGQISLAIGVWRRHFQDENLLLHIHSILEEMPEQISTPQFVPWLRNEVLPNIQRTSERMRLNSWIETRARIVESRERRPHNSLELIRLLDLGSIGSKDGICEESWSASNYLKAASFFPATPARFVENMAFLAHTAPYSTFGLHSSAGWTTVANLKKELEDLMYLWDHDDFKISLADYSQTESNQIALGLLNRVASPELLHDAVERHFKPYVERNGMAFDALLATYCMEVMDGAGAALSDSPWESRVLAILECIKAADPRLDVVIELMRRTPIPWSDSIDVLINRSMEISNHRRLNELREQYRLMQLKKMLLKYGIKVFNISDLSLAKGLVKFIVSQVEVETAMEDALQVVSAYHHLNKFDAYVLRLQRLYTASKLNSTLELLKRIQSMEPDTQDGLPNIALGVAQETLIWLNEVIEDLVEYRKDDIYPQHAHQTFSWAIDGAVQLAQFLKHGENTIAFEHFSVYNQKLANDLTCLQLLYKEFGIILTKKELGINGAKTAAAYRIIKKFSALKDHNAIDIGDSDSEDVNTRYQATFYRVADILRIPRHHMKGAIAREAALEGDFKLASLLCKEMFEKSPTPDTGGFLREVAALMTKYAVQNTLKIYGTESNAMTPFRFTSRVLQLSQKAMTVCAEDLLSDCLDECKNYDIQDAVFAQCTRGDYEIMLKYNENNDSAAECDLYGTPDVAGSSSSYCRLRSRVGWSEDVNLEAIVVDKYGSSPFENYYKEHGLVMDTQQAMTSVGLFVMEFGLKRFSDISLPLPSGKSKNKVDINPPLSQCTTTLLSYLRQNRAFQTTLRVFQRYQEHTLRETKSNGDKSVVDTDLFNDILDISLHKILSSRSVDQQLALGYMISLPMEKAFNTFKAGMATNDSDYNRLVKFADIGIGCAIIWKQRTFMVDCQQLKSNGKWWHQLKLLDIPFDEALFRLNQDGEYQRKLVPLLLSKTNFDLTAVLEFTQTYNIEDDYTLLEFIKGLLSSQNVDSFESQIIGVIDDITNKERLLSILTQVCVPQISPYDYERLHFVYMQIARIDKDNIAAKKSLIVLDVLRNYTRVNPPGSEEIIDALRNNLEPVIKKEELETTRQRLPRCTHRLPFHGIMENPWKILRPELIDDSIAQLLPLTIPLDLPTDTFYVSVVNNLLDQMHTVTHSKENAIKFSDFKGLIFKIRDLELATSLSKYISDAFPYGTDKIQSLRLAAAIAEKWHQKMEGPAGTDEAKQKTGTILDLLRKSLSQVETEFQLRSLNLMEVLEFITEPTNLIVELYNRKSEEALLEKTSFDLHALTSDIARRHGLPIEKMRLRLLQTWLTHKAESQDESEDDLPSMRMQFGQSNVSQHEISAQMRILYLLRTGILEKNVTFLLKFAYEGKSVQKVTTLARVRALSILFQLASPQEINRVQKIQEVRAYMQMLLYLADFEALRIPQTLKEFNSSNKEALARSLWVNYSDNPKVVQLLCNICLDYQIYDVTLWESVLQRLVHFKMFNYLLSILEHITAILDLMQMKSMPRLWNSVVLGSFKSCIKQGTLDFESPKLARIFILVQKCPFLLELDIGELAKLFETTVLQADLALLSFSVLPTGNEIVKTHVKSIVESLNSKEIIGVLNIFREQMQEAPKDCFSGVFNCGISKSFILNVVYAHIDAQGYYATLLNTDHMHDFILFLIRNDRLDKIVLASARIGKWKEVQRLIGLYYKIQGTKRKAKDVVDEEDNDGKGEDLLQRFVRQRGLELDITARDNA